MNPRPALRFLARMLVVALVTAGLVPLGQVSASATTPGLVPVIVVDPTLQADGTVNFTVSNYDAAFTWSATSTSGTVTDSAPYNSTYQDWTVSGLGPNETVTITITTSQTGFTTESAQQVGTSNIASPTPIFDTPVSTTNGYTVNITNYDPLFTYTTTTDNGTVAQGTASGSTLPLTVTGLAAGQSAQITAQISRSGYTTESSTVSGSALLAGLVPTFGTPVATATGFTVDVTNYDASWTWTPSVDNGAVTAGTASGATLPLTVTGLSAGQTATITLDVTRTGYVEGSGTLSATALVASSGSSSNGSSSSATTPTPTAVAPVATTPAVDAGTAPAPVAAPVTVPEVVLARDTVRFADGSSKLTRKEKASLSRLVAQVRAGQADGAIVGLLVRGYTKAGANKAVASKALVARRIAAVRNYLMRAGVNATITKQVLVARPDGAKPGSVVTTVTRTAAAA